MADPLRRFLPSAELLAQKIIIMEEYLKHVDDHITQKQEQIVIDGVCGMIEERAASDMQSSLLQPTVDLLYKDLNFESYQKPS